MSNPDHARFALACLDEKLWQESEELEHWFPCYRLRAVARPLLEALGYVPEVTSLVPEQEIRQFTSSLQNLLRASVN